MQELERAKGLIEHDLVKLGDSFRGLLHKKLVLGHTRFVCRYGALGPNHGAITNSRRYFMAIREMYSYACNIIETKAVLMEAEAELQEAIESLDSCKLNPDTPKSHYLRAQAKEFRAQNKIRNCLVTIEDQMRILDEYNKVRLELEPEVEAKYPGGIEQAELDNWVAEFEYRIEKEKTPGLPREHISNIPLDPIIKAELGLKYNRPDAVAPLLVGERRAIEAIADGNVSKFINSVKDHQKKLNGTSQGSST